MVTFFKKYVAGHSPQNISIRVCCIFFHCHVWVREKPLFKLFLLAYIFFYNNHKIVTELHNPHNSLHNFFFFFFLNVL